MLFRMLCGVTATHTYRTVFENYAVIVQECTFCGKVRRISKF